MISRTSVIMSPVLPLSLPRSLLTSNFSRIICRRIVIVTNNTHWLIVRKNRMIYGLGAV